MDREVKQPKQSQIPIVKVFWNSCRGPEFTWEREDYFKSKYPHIFLSKRKASMKNRAPGRRSRVLKQTWHRRLGHPGSKVMRHLISNNVISCNKEKPPRDHCGEFDNRKLYDLFNTNGIQFCFSFLNTSQQNGKSERMTLVPRPPDANVARYMWLFGHKFLADGMLSRYNARLVANGSTQLEGVDVDETFSPVVKPGTIRTGLSLAVSRQWPIHQLDVKNAFLHGDLTETIYMHQPPGFQDSTHPDYRIIRSLHQEFAITDFGPLNYFLGVSVTRDSSGLFLSQQKYVIEILKKAHILNCNPIRTPVDTESKLGVGGDPVSDATLYWSLAGSLQYLTFTRPDISYAVQQVCLHIHDPREPCLSALKRILRYVQGTLNYSLQLFSSSITDLVAYSDADWAGCPTTRRSTSGYCVFLGNNFLSWSSKRQPTLSRSSADAEYRGFANVVAETCWLRNLLHLLQTPLSSATLIYCDNVRVLHVSSRYQFADIFTKGLPSALFEEFRTSLSIRCPPALTAKEC
ncbi:ribonuclease H-like domain-containing protein [Tanacetum coccineum]